MRHTTLHLPFQEALLEVAWPSELLMHVSYMFACIVLPACQSAFPFAYMVAGDFNNCLPHPPSTSPT